MSEHRAVSYRYGSFNCQGVVHGCTRDTPSARIFVQKDIHAIAGKEVEQLRVRKKCMGDLQPNVLFMNPVVGIVLRPLSREFLVCPPKKSAEDILSPDNRLIEFFLYFLHYSFELPFLRALRTPKLPP